MVRDPPTGMVSKYCVTGPVFTRLTVIGVPSACQNFSVNGAGSSSRFARMIVDFQPPPLAT